MVWRRRGLGPHHLADPARDGRQLDNKELGPARIVSAVFVPGALFSCGDGHGVQATAKSGVTAIGDALAGRLTDAPQGLRLSYPRAETQTHYMTMAMDPTSINGGARAARHDRAARREAQSVTRGCYTLCSLAADLRVTQTVNGSKGIHCMIERNRARVSAGSSDPVEASYPHPVIGDTRVDFPMVCNEIGRSLRMRLTYP